MKWQRRRLLVVTAATLVLFWVADRSIAFGAGETVADRPATHNMLIVGEEAVYLSHLPMFQEDGKAPMPHRYQVILEVTFAKQEDYAKDRQGHRSTTIYTLNPEEFVLPKLASSDPEHPPLRSFKAKTIFRGHLERDGSLPILQDVEVAVKRVVLFRELALGAEKSSQRNYLLFGRGRDLFLTHLITAPPDFDQILFVEVPGAQFTDAELSMGIPVVFPGARNTAADRLTAKQQLEGEAIVGSPPALVKIQVDVVGEIYFEEGELRMPPLFGPTPEEERAGFP